MDKIIKSLCSELRDIKSHAIQLNLSNTHRSTEKDGKNHYKQKEKYISSINTAKLKNILKKYSSNQQSFRNLKKKQKEYRFNSNKNQDNIMLFLLRHKLRKKYNTDQSVYGKKKNKRINFLYPLKIYPEL
ncbi:MAG: hypothetical protein MJ149_01200, partial [Clostridia bacterium]|nr:hypothetical protein [Clostridia bacterium]